jgi:predicted TPR repeat methyltransferase
MIDQKLVGEKAKDFFEDIWSHDDHWALESSEYEKRRFETILSMICDRRYNRVLEIGCGRGTFTKFLSTLADEVVALDISNAAIDRAQTSKSGGGVINYQVANIMEFDLRSQGQWDLIVFSETIYLLGWLYSYFQIGWLAFELLTFTNNGGRLMLANTLGKAEDFSSDMVLHLPWHIYSYRDLFINVGYKLENERIFEGHKDGTDLQVLISLFQR